MVEGAGGWLQLPSDEVGGPHEDGGWLGEEDLSELSSDTLDVYFPAALMPGRVEADVRYWLPPRPLAHSPPPKTAAAVGDVARNRSDTQSRSEATVGCGAGAGGGPRTGEGGGGGGGARGRDCTTEPRAAPAAASGDRAGHPGFDWGWSFPVSALETYGPWLLAPSATRQPADLRVPEDEASVSQAVARGESTGTRVYISGDEVPHQYAQVVLAGVHVAEPGFEENHTDVGPTGIEPCLGHPLTIPEGLGGKGDGLVFKSPGRWLPWRRVFNEYDPWQGYLNKPRLPAASSRRLTVAGNARARVWGRWMLQEGVRGGLDCLSLVNEAGPGGLRADARYPSGTFGPFPDYTSGPLRHVIGPCGRHLCGRPLALAPVSYNNMATVSIEGGPWAVDRCQVRSAGGVAVLAQRWCTATVNASILGGLGGAKDLFWARVMPEWARDTRMASDGLAVCDRAEVCVTGSVIEDTGYNGGDCAHALNDAELRVAGCSFRYSLQGLGIDDGAFVSVANTVMWH